MMQMTFYQSVELTLWFDSWKTTTLLPYAGTLLFLSCVAALYEFTLALRVQCEEAVAKRASRRPHREHELLGDQDDTHDDATVNRRCNPRSVASTTSALADVLAGANRSAPLLLYGCGLLLSYMLMLAVMTFNVGVLVAVCVGMVAGHALFVSERVSDNPAFGSGCC